MVVSSSRSRALGALKSIFGDALYRGSLIMLGNSASLAIFGFVFWLLATHTYSASAVGEYASIISGAGLLAAVTSLGLPNTITRRIASAANPRQLMRVALIVTTLLGGVLCLLTVLLVGPRLPAELKLGQRGATALLLTGLVVFTAISTILDAALVAMRATPALAKKNLIGSVIKIAVLVLLAGMGSFGLLMAYGLGISISSVLSGLALWRRLDRGGEHVNPMRLLRINLSMTAGNYASMIMGILPSTIVPIQVLIILGSAAAGRFAVAFTLAGLLNVIPSTVAQVLFAETSRQGVTLGAQLRKALRGTYALLLPPLVILMAGAPLVLRLFGATYVTAAGCLRVLLLSALFTGGTYLVDSILIARDRIVAYTFMNGANAALVVGGVAVLLPYGLTAGAWGWTGAQGLSLLLGAAVIATGKAGRHRAAVRRAQKREPWALPEPQTVTAYESRIRDLLETWPMMPTTGIAERIGWHRPVSLLLDQVIDLRMDYLSAENYQGEDRPPPGELAHCGLWFPPVEVPVGSGQTRSATQLPVLTMIAGYSRWLSALLIPSSAAEDLFTGSWQLLVRLGAVPKALVWTSQPTVGRRLPDGGVELTAECTVFANALGTDIIIGGTADPRTGNLVEWTHAWLERAFLADRTFTSPMDFNTQLADWLTGTNNQMAPLSGFWPAEMMAADKRAMLPLPPAPPPTTGWCMPVLIGARPFIRFDSNQYSVHPRATRHHAEIIADLSHVSVVCDGRVAADHRRSWARNQIITDPDHLTGAGPARVGGS